MRFNYEVVKFTNGKYGARFFEVSLNRFGYSYIGTGKGGYLAYCKHLPKKENSYGFNIFFESACYKICVYVVLHIEFTN